MHPAQADLCDTCNISPADHFWKTVYHIHFYIVVHAFIVLIPGLDIHKDNISIKIKGSLPEEIKNVSIAIYSWYVSND